MGRRRLVVLLSAITMMVIGGAIVGGLMVATQSDGGREWIRAQLQRAAGRVVHGKLHLGKLSGSFLTDFAVDSITIVGPDDSVFIATGPTHFTYDPRDLLDGRIIFRSVEIQHPFFVFRKDADNTWNYNKVFPPSGGAPVVPVAHAVPGRRVAARVEREPPSRSAFGAVLQFRNVRIRGLHFRLTVPWSPDDSLKGVKRDSAIVRNLAAKDQEIHPLLVKGKRAYQRTTNWTEGDFTFNSIRLRSPDSPGRRFDIARLDVNEQSPPFAVRNLRGVVQWTGDSLKLDIRHLELPGSVARGSGLLEWANDRPVHYDLVILSDSVSLDDVAWIAPSIPRTGGGSVVLRIKTDQDQHLLDYAITKMDLRTNASRLRGAMTFAVGGPVLILKDMDLEASPVDFALIETMNRGKFAQPWNGTFTGMVRARGGPLDHFVVDTLHLRYADRNVTGASSEFSGRGELDIRDPANTTFHGFHLDLARLDLRTPQFLSDGFPRLNGVLAGDATLDSVWTDVRFSDADITHTDGDSTPPSRVKGDIRLTSSGPDINFEVAVAALPLSLNTIARSYRDLPIRGAYTGPIRVQGELADFSANVDLSGDAGRVQLEGRFDASAPGYRASSRGSVQALDLKQFFARPGAPSTSLNGRFTTEIEGDSLPNLIGTAQLTADRSLVDGVRVFGAQTALRFAGGVMQVDSLRAESASGTLTARGGIGLSAARTDSLAFHLDVDSLGGLRKYLVQARAAAVAVTRADTAAVALSDSLGGTISANGVLSGNLSRVAVRANAVGAQLRMGSVTARQATINASVGAIPDSSTGAVNFEIDTVRVGTLGYSRIAGRDSLIARDGHRLTLSARSALDSARATAEVSMRGDTAAVRIDSLSIQTSADSWLLRHAARLQVVHGSVAIDSIALRGRRGGSLSVSGGTSGDSVLAVTLRADSVPLSDIGELLQQQTPLEGTATGTATLSGMRDNPAMHFDATLRNGVLMGLQLDEVHANGEFADRMLSTSFAYSRAGVRALYGTATLPLDLSPGAGGSRLIEAPLRATIHTDSGGMGVLASLSKSVTKASGTLALDANVTGTWKHPLLSGALVVHNGELSLEQLGAVRLTALEANVGFHGDSITGIVSAHSGSTKPATGTLSGVIGIRDIDRPTYNLKLSAQSFNVIDRARFATLDLTGNLGLTGASDAATLTGSLTVDRGTIAIPELVQKHLISLDDPEFYNVVDTSAFEDRRLLPTPPSSIISNLAVDNLTVRMGREVWLKSSEANINLGGQVTVKSGHSQRGKTAGRVQLQLDGALQTVRGTYSLKLAPGVSRTFTVENGSVRFFGDQDLDGALDINGLYTVRQSSQQSARPDVRVRVHIGGTLLAPGQPELSSPDSQRVALSQADLVSYLATGQPSSQIGGTNDYASTAANVLLNTGFQFNTGGLCDQTQLSAGVLDASQQGRNTGGVGGVLSGSRFNCARQLGDRAFLRLDYGLCRVGQLVGGGGSNDPLDFADAIGVKVDYELNTSLMLSGGMEPSTSAVLCTSNASARGFAPTPRQYGIDLFRVWRF
ncbi:MAG: translocation/assembly module TamB domain-containing protein [Gemmatimonadales bacterium]